MDVEGSLGLRRAGGLPGGRLGGRRPARVTVSLTGPERRRRGRGGALAEAAGFGGGGAGDAVGFATHADSSSAPATNGGAPVEKMRANAPRTARRIVASQPWRAIFPAGGVASRQPLSRGSSRTEGRG